MIEDSAIPVQAKPGLPTKTAMGIMLDVLATKGYPAVSRDIRAYIDDLEARNAALLAACKAVVKENLMLGGHFLRREALYDLPVVIAWAEGKAVPT